MLQRRYDKNVVLVVGGSDSAGCSGILADARAIHALGGHAATVVSVVTAQHTRAVCAWEPVSDAVFAAQLNAVGEDLRVAAVKIGILGSATQVRLMAQFLAAHPELPVVLDPVLASSTGQRFVDEATCAAMQRDLFPHVTLVTPNAMEASQLCSRVVASPEDAISAGKWIVARGAHAVLIKGGHFDVDRGADVWVASDGQSQVFRLLGVEKDAMHTRGTGCTLASSIACLLAEGLALIDAIGFARVFVNRAIRHGYAVGKGHELGGAGPIDALYFLRRARSQALGRLHVIAQDAALAKLALAGGADVIQFRDKRSQPTAQLLAQAKAIADCCCETDGTLIVNDRVDVAGAAADFSCSAGVHLGREDLDPSIARQLLGPRALIGATANNLDQAKRALRQPIDYLGVGPVFGTSSKENPAPTLGLDTLAAIANDSPVPVIAIGNITPERVASVMAAGAHGIAVLSGVSASADPIAATRRYRQMVEEAR